MRLLGATLLFFGLVATVVGLLTGCNALFSWNGKHAIDTYPLNAGASTLHTLSPEPGRRYTVSVEVVFDREGLDKKEGVVVVDAKLPLVVRVKDEHGTSLAQVMGFLDPNEPPNVLYGQAAHESAHPSAMPELVVERLVGPFGAASNAPITIDVDLGTDRVGVATILARRLVIHDDALPPAVKHTFVVAGFGGLVLTLGLGLLMMGTFKRRRGRTRRPAAT